MGRSKWLLAVFAIVSAVCLVAVDQAEARRGGSFGSRGTRTYQAPPTTTTAPAPAAPIQRSTTPQAQPGQPNRAAPGAQQARPSMFGSGLAGGLMRGLMIGGLIGLLMGSGFGGMAGLLGLLVQGALIALVVFLVMRFFRRPQPVTAGGPNGMARMGGFPGAGGSNDGPRSALGGMMGGGNAPQRPAPAQAPAYAAAPAAAPRRNGKPDEIGLAAEDYDAFEGLLSGVLTAYGREDQGELKQLTTDEVFAYFSDELRENSENGVRTEISDVQMLQGDLAEAWREGNRDYATVAIRFSSFNRTVDRTSGQYVSGDQQPGESTELWTFLRDNRGPWKLSAIQSM